MYKIINLIYAVLLVDTHFVSHVFSWYITLFANTERHVVVVVYLHEQPIGKKYEI